jgi:hypothetical protein
MGLFLPTKDGTIMDNKVRRFKGKWITSAEFAPLQPVNVFHREMQPPVEVKGAIENRHILFRKKFPVDTVKKSSSRAYIYITADDYYKLYINGAFITQGPCPGYPFHYYYNSIDVTSFLEPGDNILAVHTYYQGLINRVWISGDNRHGLLLDMEIDGETILQSDESFLYREHSGFSVMGKAGYNTQFTERYDSSAEEKGFEMSGFNDSKWDHALLKENTDYIVSPQPTCQLEFEKIAPVSLLKTSRGYIADFGSVYVGYVSLSAKGKKGEGITVLQGQELNDDGSVRFDMRANCKYEEEWILSGGKDTLDQFDYKSFRYVELVVPEGCDIYRETFCIHARHYPFKAKASCNVKDPRLQAVWKLCLNSLRYGVQEVVQDCMDREKAQYLGDGLYSSFSQGIVTKDFSIFEKLIFDALRGSFITPTLMSCFPCSFMQEHADYPLLLPMFCFMHYHITGNAYPLLFDLCPDKKAEQNIIEFIRKKGISELSFYITYAILAALTRVGETELCLDLIAGDAAWSRMIREGATTTWEAWTKDGKWNSSLFHLAFTFPVHFLTDWDMKKVFDTDSLSAPLAPYRGGAIKP